MMIVAKTIDDADLERGLAHDDRRRQSLGLRPRRVLAQAPDHVLHVDDRVVHQRADGDRHAAERHRVDAGAERPQREHRRRQRQRHRRQRDRAGAEVGEEQQHDHDDQNAAVAQRA